MDTSFSFRQWLEAVEPGPAQVATDRVLGATQAALGATGHGTAGLARRMANYIQGGEGEAMRQIRSREFVPFEPQDPAIASPERFADPEERAKYELEDDARDQFLAIGDSARLTKENVRAYLAKVNGDFGAKNGWLRNMVAFLGQKIKEGIAHTGHWFYETAISPDIFIRLASATKAWCGEMIRVKRERDALDAQLAARQISKGAHRRQNAALAATLKNKAQAMKDAWRDLFKFKVYGTIQGHLMWYVMAVLMFSGMLHDHETELVLWKVGVYVLMALQALLSVVGAFVPMIGKLGNGLEQFMTTFRPEAFKGDHGEYDRGDAAVASRPANTEPGVPR